jgi:hypothetical protein
MFKPSDPDEPLSEREADPKMPHAFGMVHLVFGTALLASGLVGLIYGSLIETMTRPDAGEGLLAGFLGGLAAGLGEVFQTMGWVLLGLGGPVALAGWGWTRSKPWARILTQILGVLAVIAGLWLLTRLAIVESLLPLAYAALVGWILGRP